MADLEIRAFNRRLLIVWDKRKEASQTEYNTAGSFDPVETDTDSEMLFGLRG